MRLHRALLLSSALFLSAFPALAQPPAPATLKDTFRNAFLVGAAINTPQITGRDTLGDAIVTQQFNSISRKT